MLPSPGSGTPTFSRKRTQIEAAVSKFMASSHVPGVSVAVVENAEYEWGGGFAWPMWRTTRRPANTRSSGWRPSPNRSPPRLPWNSGARKLDLDAPVQKYCPAFPQKSWPITTRQVMGTPGRYPSLQNRPDDLEIGNTRHFENPIQAGIDFFKNDPLLSEPGKQFHYSTQGYTVVGCVIEGASGGKYVDFVRQNVFVPLAWSNTQVGRSFCHHSLSHAFLSEDRIWRCEERDFLDSSYKIPGGGWLSSAEDMARFEVAI